MGSEFASRHTQYEMLYAGARNSSPPGHSFRTFDWAPPPAWSTISWIVLFAQKGAQRIAQKRRRAYILVTVTGAK